jgi:hypothetical protein
METNDQRSPLSRRLLALVNAKLGHEKNFYSALERTTGVDRETWKHWYLKPQVADPSTKILSASFKVWPQYAFWLATGIEDDAYGHISVSATESSNISTTEQHKKVRVVTELYFDSFMKTVTCNLDDLEHHLHLVEYAQKLRIKEVAKLCLEISNGNQES